MERHPFDRVTESELRRRRSAKWTYYPEDVLPAWLAEMDFPLDEGIRSTLHHAIDVGDCGYAESTGLGDAFATWAKGRWGWPIDADDVHLVADVVTGIAELLLAATRPGDGVVIDTPVYHPFAETIRRSGRTVVEAPLASTTLGWSLDLDAIERAYVAGARVHLLCSPHNPTGIVYPRQALVRVAELAEKHDVLVLSDEIHAPLTFPGVTHHPFPLLSAAAARRSIVLTSASKAWNVAGLKAAVMVASGDEGRALLAQLPPDVPFHAGHLGVLAGRAAFRDGGAWLESTVRILDRNRHALTDLLREHLPGVRYLPPQASYLAWLDCRALGLGPDPARTFLERGRVALSSGPMFGMQGAGFARLNIATTRALLEEAVRRMATALG